MIFHYRIVKTFIMNYVLCLIKCELRKHSKQNFKRQKFQLTKHFKSEKNWIKMSRKLRIFAQKS